MESPDLRICSYNIGSNVNDYGILNTYLRERQIHPSAYNAEKFQDLTNVFNSKDTSDKRAEYTNEYQKKYSEIEKVVAERLIPSAEVFCLQEVSTFNRPILQQFKARGFTIIQRKNQQPGETFETAIALDTHRFKNIQNFSFAFVGGGDVACAKATDKTSNRDFLFVSCHIPGFDLNEVKDLQEKLLQAKEETEKAKWQHQIQGLVADGDEVCKAIVKQLQHIGAGCTVVIGSDVNAFPEIWKERFDVFTNAQFSVHRTQKPTNVFGNFLGPVNQYAPKITEEDRVRELDFFFTQTRISKLPRRSVWQNIKSLVNAIFFKTISPNTLKIDNPNLKHAISFNPALNMSDHLPIYTTIHQTNTQHQSLTHLFWKATLRRLKGLFT